MGIVEDLFKQEYFLMLRNFFDRNRFLQVHDNSQNDMFAE